MEQLKFKIYHQGCWGSKISEKIGHLEWIPLSWAPYQLTKKYLIFKGTWEIRGGTVNDIEKIMKILRMHKDVLDIKLIQKNENSFIITTEVIQHNSTYETIIKSDCILFSLPTMENGYETYNTVVPKSGGKMSLLKELSEIGELKILKVKKYEANIFNLSQKQDIALRTAIANEYYSWPKRITLGRLAEKLNISRSVFEEHLRKAEGKILPSIIKDKPQF